MTLQDLKALVERAKWFTAVGNFDAGDNQFALTSLRAWDRSGFDAATCRHDAMIAGEMDWLPSTRDQDDPIHESKLINRLRDAGVVYKATVLEIQKAGVHSLRNISDQTLRSGPNDFTPAATGAALFCVRMATIEVLANERGFWCAVLLLYCDGYWPCGLMPDGHLVVY